MKALAIYEQPHAEWLGECYVAITPESMKEMVMRINDNADAVPDPDNPEVFHMEEIKHQTPQGVTFADPSQHELSDYDALRLCERPWMLYQWLDVGMAAFIPYEKCQLFLGDRIRTYDIEDIEIAAPKLPVAGVEEGTECFVIHLRYW